ncbi:hypothetical protein D3C85_1555740 [compost metagenome]
MRLVDHQDDPFRRVYHTKSLACWYSQVGAQRLSHGITQDLFVLLKLVHHDHIDVGAVCGQVLA